MLRSRYVECTRALFLSGLGISWVRNSLANTFLEKKETLTLTNLTYIRLASTNMANQTLHAALPDYRDPAFSLRQMHGLYELGLTPVVGVAKGHRGGKN